MPFTSPSTYASKSTTGYKTTFLIGDSASPPNYVAVMEVKSIKPQISTTPQVPTSHLQSVANTEEFIPGMIKPGTVTLGGNFIGDATQLQFNTLQQAQTVFPWKVIASVQAGAKTYTVSGIAFVSKYENGPFENNKAIEFATDIQISGAVTETVA